MSDAPIPAMSSESLAGSHPRPGRLPVTILTEPLAGLQSQAIGLAEAAGLDPNLLPLTPRPPWSWITARPWPDPLAAVRLPPVPDGVIMAAGGTAAVVAARLRNPARLAQAAALWAPRFADLPRPLVAVLVGGSNGRFRLDAPVAQALASQLMKMMRTDRIGLALTPSRRTAPEAQAALAAIRPLGGWMWNMTGENPYYGLLALADAIIVTEDSVSMVSEAVATSAPVLLPPLPGKSRRIRLFNELLIRDGRIRPFAGRLETWDTAPLDDTKMAGEEIRHRLSL